MLDFLNEDIFSIDADLYVVPISTAGTISESFKIGLNKFRVHDSSWNYLRMDLGQIELHKSWPEEKLIAYVCTVDNNAGSSAYYAIRDIGRQLAKAVSQSQYGEVRSIATPILGTGAGNLKPEFSLNIMRSAFFEVNENTDIIFCTMDRHLRNSLIHHNFDITSSSASLVVEAEIPRILNSGYIQKIAGESDIYFEAAIDKFKEFLNFKSDETKFFRNLYDLFRSSQKTFQEFLNFGLSEEDHQFTILCGELIAYIDYRAYYKNIWNKTSDKRVLAQSAVRQNDWFLNLLKFRIYRDFDQLSPSPRAALMYLSKPQANLTMLSKNHRESIRRVFFSGSELQSYPLEQLVTNWLENLGVIARNQVNHTALCTRVLYDPLISRVWLEKFSVVKLKGTIREEADLERLGMLIRECIDNQSTYLDLGNCGLTDLSVIPELFLCTHIETLVLSNEWAEYKDSKWRPRKSKNFGPPNNLKSLPEEIEMLTSLRNLLCGGDWRDSKTGRWNRWEINSLSVISRLENLEYLNISNNKIKSLKGLNKLKRLERAHLNNNEIVEVSDLSELKNLIELNLSNNRIKDVTFLKGAFAITTLDLHNNAIKDLRPLRNLIGRIGIMNAKWQPLTINIAKNPLEYPSMDFIELGRNAVLGAFEDIERRGKYINEDVKVILVGNSAVGKSTLVKYLNFEHRFDEEHPSTVWMEISAFKSKEKIESINAQCTLRVFDFGGHDYFHDTHHSFFGVNTVYILLWDTETNLNQTRPLIQKIDDSVEIATETRDYPIKYWLDSIKYLSHNVEAENFAFEIDKKTDYPIELLLIQNKVKDPSDIQFLFTEELWQEYPFVFESINISMKKGERRNLKHLDNVFTEMLNKMKIIGAVLPQTYQEVKDRISNYQGKAVLSMDEFLDYCNEPLGSSKLALDIEECRRLVNYFMQVGIVIYSKRYDRERVYINKTWLTKTMYTVLSKLKDMHGEFDKEHIQSVLQASDQDIQDLINIMEDFKIIFKHPASDKFIAPLYLPEIPDDKIGIFLNRDKLPYRRFDSKGFIHKNIILDIFQNFASTIVSDQFSNNSYYWKDALIIKDPDTSEIVMIKFSMEEDESNGCIYIYDLSSSDSQTKLIEKVRQYILTFNQRYELEEMVTLDGKDYISLSVLNSNAKSGKYIFSEQVEADFGKKKDELKFFNLKNYMDYIDNPIRKREVVISYSQYDIDYMHELKRYLQPLVRHDLIEEPWSCECLITSTPWDKVIKDRFNKADIVIFLVSANLMSTKYVTENEITSAIDRYDLDNSSVKIVPIVLDHYDWSAKGKYDLQRFSAMPFKGKAVRDYNNPNIAWHMITHAIRIMVEHDISPESNGAPSREIEKLYERQVAGKLDNNAN